MPRESQDVTEAELELLRVLWEQGKCSTRQLTDALHPRAQAAQYATVQKQLERLEAKGFVHRDRSLFVHTFTAAVDRDELIGRQLRAVARKLCGGSLGPLLTHLVQGRALSAKERAMLREMIESTNAAEPSAKRSR
ncbi:MAG TPA: BlaI/MecI/CopY family transcriptional regulator [Humisphaera sp.]|jgi:predicted transcriptional regulator|nr:BlaI/MecI/CopY family transcriptional regulator [Humisphaera sp.]